MWIIIGGIAGAIADRVIQGTKLGCLGNIVVGVIGGFILDKVFDIQVSSVFWTFITALVEASLLLLIVGFLNGGRGIGRRIPTPRWR